MKKLFATVLILGLAIFSSMGCVTKSLWDEKGSRTVQDTIIAFYANPQNGEIIFIGNKYHYIFNEGTLPLQDVLKAKDFLRLNKSNLTIFTDTQPDDPSIIMTRLGITFDSTQLSSQQNRWLREHGFRLITPATPIIRKGFLLRGRRYSANKEVNSKAKRLKEPIEIQVIEPKNNTLYKLLMTPLSVTADAGLAIAGTIILPLIWLNK